MKMIIGGKLVDRDEKIPVYNPEDESIIDYVPSASEEDVKEAYRFAEEGAKEMEKLSSYDRYKILRDVSLYVENNLEELSRIIATEGIKTINEARKEAKRAANTLMYAAEEAKRLQGEILHVDADFRRVQRSGFWYREPVGIVLAITPYNDPLNMVAHKLSPAIAAGNAVVLKPTYLTPLSAIKLGIAFLEAGLPEKALSIITGKSGKIGDALVSDPRPRVITFTGGVEAGLDISRKAGLKKLMMELGSSSVVIVDFETDVNRAAELTAEGSFYAAGQNCIGVQRVYIHRKIYDEFVPLMVEATKKIKVGPKLDENTTMGPMITKEEADRVESWINEAVEAGGKVLIGGERKGNYIMPTIIENPPAHTNVAKEEVFGPVVCLYNYEELDDAIDMANSSRYGLHAAIFTENIHKAMKAIKGLKFGGVMVNDSTDFRVDYMPFGGYKYSGLNREGLRFAIEVMTEIKTVIIS